MRNDTEAISPADPLPQVGMATSAPSDSEPLAPEQVSSSESALALSPRGRRRVLVGGPVSVSAPEPLTESISVPGIEPDSVLTIEESTPVSRVEDGAIRDGAELAAPTLVPQPASPPSGNGLHASGILASQVAPAYNGPSTRPLNFAAHAAASPIDSPFMRAVALTRQFFAAWTHLASWLLFCALNSTFVYYLAFYLPYRLSEYYAVPLINYGQFKFPNPGVLAAGWLILFQLYYVAFRATPKRSNLPLKVIAVGFPIVVSWLLVFMYPFGANDMFDHMFRGHMWGHLGVSPFGLVPSSYPNDFFYQFVWWKDLAASYGPVWEFLAGMTSKIAGFDLWANVVAYKLLVVLHFWGSMALVYVTLKRLRPEYAWAGFVLFAWNPLVIFEFAGNGHSDGMLVFWMLAAVCLLVYERHLLALMALTVGVMVKFVPILLVPLFLVAFFHAQSKRPLRYRFVQLGIAFAAMGGVVLLSYLPFGLDTLTTNIKYLLGRDAFVEATVSWLARQWLEMWRGMTEPDAQNLVHNVGLLLLALLIMWHTGRLLWRSFKTTDRREITNSVIERSYEILFAYFFLGALWFRPWYITWLLAFAPFIKRFGYAERTVLLCFTSLANYFVIYYGWPWHFDDRIPGHIALVQLEFLLPFLLTLGTWGWQLIAYLRGRNRVGPGGQSGSLAGGLYSASASLVAHPISLPAPSGVADDGLRSSVLQVSLLEASRALIRFLSKLWLHRGIWLGIVALVVSIVGQGILFQPEHRGDGALMQVLAMGLAAVAWSGLRDAPLLTRTHRGPRKRLEDLLTWRWTRAVATGSGTGVKTADTRPLRANDTRALTRSAGVYKRWRVLVTWRHGLALRLAGIAFSLLLLFRSYQSYYQASDAIFGAQGYLWLASMSVLLLSCARWYPRDNEALRAGPAWTRREAIIFASIVAISFFTHLSWLNEVPWVIDVNEYTAWKETMHFYREPVSISMFTTTWLDLGLPSLWFWFQAWPMRVFGDGLVGVRYITGLTGAFMTIPVYLMARMLWGRMAAALAGFSVVFLTVILHNARQSSNNIATALWWTLCFYFLLKGLRTKRPGDFVWAGLWAGTSMYTYYGTRLLPYLLLVFVAYMAIFHFRAFRERIGHFALVAVGFMVGFGPLYAYFTWHPDKWAGRGISEMTVPLAIPSSWEQWVQYWNVISDEIRQNFFSLSVIPAQDTFFFAPFLRPVEAILLVLGLGALVWRWRQPASFLIILWAGSVMLVASLINIPINPNPNFTHWAPAWPVFYLALALPPALFLRSLRRFNVNLWKVGVAVVSVGFVWIAAADFYFYLVTYPPLAPAVMPVSRAVQGRFMASVEPGTVVRYVGCCLYDYEYASAFAPKTTLGQFSNISRQLPIVGDAQHKQIFYIPGWPNPYVPILKHYYPGGHTRDLIGPDGITHYATIVDVTPDQLMSRYGVQVTVADRTGQNVLATGQVPAVGALPLGNAAFTYPVVATWSGSFYVNAPGLVQVRVDGAGTAGVASWVMSRPGALGQPLDLDAGWVPFVIKAQLDGPARQLHFLKTEAGAPEVELTTPYLWPEGANMGLAVSLGNTTVTRVDPFVGSASVRSDANYFQPGVLPIDEVRQLFHPLTLTPQYPNGDALAHWSGEVYAEGGNYGMELALDGKGQLIIDGRPVINNCNIYPGGIALAGGVAMTPGWHKVELTMQTNGPGGGLVPRGLEWMWTRPDGMREVVPPTRLRYSSTMTPDIAPTWPAPPQPLTCNP